MAVLSREQILEVQDVKTEIVTVPEWGGDIRIRMLTAKQRDEWDGSFEVDDSGKIKPECLRNVRARLVAMCAVDESGNPLFQPGDVKKLGEKSAAALVRIHEACRRLSGMDQEAVEKNLPITPADDSSIG